MTSSYDHLKTSQQAEIHRYRVKLQTMTDNELAKACDEFIWLSAYAANNPTSAYHWMCDFTYDECKKRDRVDIYSKAHDRLMAEARGR